MIATQPLRKASGGGITVESVEASISSQVEQVIMTRGFTDGIVGELLWDVDFGSGVELMRHRKERSSTSDIEILKYYCADSLKRYVPDITVTSITITKVSNSSGLGLQVLIEWELNKVKQTTTLSI